jgi:hypothetical protein
MKREMKDTKATHETFVSAVRNLAATRIGDEAKRAQILAAKLVYGVGSGTGARGVTYYSAWQNGEPLPVDVIEVCATGEESNTQLIGTTIHETGHVLAGYGSGHGPAWKVACAALGLTTAEAGGQAYQQTDFDSILWAAAQALKVPVDGKPVFRGAGMVVGLVPRKPRPCSMGIGTRGGKSRGAGSGSRLRLFECKCPKPVKVRVASDTFAAHCDVCSEAFTRIEKGI